MKEVVNSRSSDEAIFRLQRKVEITRKSRHAASRHLRIHNALSQWTLSVLAATQIIVSMSLAMFPRSDEKFMNYMLVCISVLTLAYSLIVGMGDFSARSKKMHDCALRLDMISNEISGIVNAPLLLDRDYRKMLKRYKKSLEKQENHKQVDYSEARYEHERTMWYWVLCYVRKMIQFFHYAIIWGFCIWFVSMLWPK